MFNAGLTNGDTCKVTAWLHTSESGLYSPQNLKNMTKNKSQTWNRHQLLLLSTFWNLLSKDTWSFCLLFACDGNPEYSLEGLMLKLNLQYSGHLIWIADSLEKSLILGNTEGRRRRGCQKMRRLDGITMQWTWTWANSGRWWWTGRPGVLQSMGSQRVRRDWATEQQEQKWLTQRAKVAIFSINTTCSDSFQPTVFLVSTKYTCNV